MINLIGGSIAFTLSALITIFTPVFTGTSIDENSNKEVGIIEYLIIGAFVICDLLRLPYIFIFFNDLLYYIIDLILSHIHKAVDAREKEKSIITLIIIILTITIITFLYGLIGKELFPDVFQDLSNTIIGSLGEEKMSLKLMLDILFASIGSLSLIVKTKLWGLKLLILCLLGILYVSIIYFGLVDIGQIKEESSSKFNVKAITFKNFLILSFIIFIFNIIMGVIPAFDKIKLIVDILSIYNIEISVSAVAATVIPIVAEKAVRHIINNKINKSNVFHK